MSDKTYIYMAVLLAVVAVATAISAIYSRDRIDPENNGDLPPVKENFAGMGVSFTTKAIPEMRGNQGYFFSVPPNLQAATSPRFSGTATYGPYLNTRMTGVNNQGVPVNPLTQRNTVKSCGNGVNVFDNDNMKMKENFHNVAPNFSSANYRALEDSLPDREGVITNDLLPMSDLTAGTNGESTVAQPIVYDRYIYANQKSRLYGLGDPIRGDLPIVPYNGDWFRPSVQPNIDLRDGAMMVMAGENNATARNTMALMRQASGNTMNTFAGAPVMADESNVGYGAGGADVFATAFP